MGFLPPPFTQTKMKLRNPLMITLFFFNKGTLEKKRANEFARHALTCRAFLDPRLKPWSSLGFPLLVPTRSEVFMEKISPT